MTAGDYDIICEQGATFSRTLTVKDSSGDARNLSSFTGKMQVRKLVTSTDTLAELTTSNGKMTLNASGEISLSLTATETAAITSSGVYDLEITSSGGVVERVVEGNFNLIPEVTR